MFKKLDHFITYYILYSITASKTKKMYTYITFLYLMHVSKHSIFQTHLHFIVNKMHWGDILISKITFIFSFDTKNTNVPWATYEGPSAGCMSHPTLFVGHPNRRPATVTWETLHLINCWAQKYQPKKHILLF